MVCWIKRSILFFALSSFHFAYANDYATTVKNVETTLQNDYYILAADLNYHLSKKAIEALQNGVPLLWTIKIKVKKQRPFWFDKTDVKHEIHFRLQYHALLKMYRVKNENTGVVNNFSTLTAALDDMATIRNFSLIEKTILAEKKHYSIAIKVLFEDSELPLPLQTQVLLNPQWQLSSDWSSWNLQ
jgi:hypothetical protein